MKRTRLLLIVLLLIVTEIQAQISGSGTLTDPYHGINSGNFTISGIKYFNANIGVSSGTLELTPGSVLISINRIACIIISGTGALVINGSEASPVTISADPDQDGIIGESSEFWGNIQLNSTGQNTINHAIIENGRRVRFGILGGGIYATSGTLNISNTTIRNCYAFKGGGIYMLPAATINISQTFFENNRAYEQGGALFLEPGSAPVITSCLFYNNQAQSATLKGGAITSLSSSPVVVNCTFTNNQSAAADGTTFYLENSPSAKIVNTVIWGGSSHIGLSGTPSTVFDLCAIEGVSYSGCLTLSSINTDPDGPNFTDPASGDFSLAFASPMRDSGTESYPGLEIPELDILGRGRVGVIDRGAYEMLYSRWHGGNISWSDPSNWDAGITPGSTSIIIPSGMPTYPTNSPGPNFILNSGLEMILYPGAKVTFNFLFNNGRIDLLSDATGISSMIVDRYTGLSGNLNIDLHLTAGPAGIDWWHYITTPITMSKTVFTDIEPEMLARYDETRVITDVVDGWQWHDGYGGTTPFSELKAKEGYDVSVATDVTMTFRNLKSMLTTLGTINLPFSGSGGDTTIYGYSLLGNSLTCGINWDRVTYSHDHTLIRHAYYVRTASGEEASYVDGVGTNGATAHIAPLQGFFVRTRATGTYITIPLNAREHNAAPRFKSADQISLVRLALSSAAARDEMVIRFEPEATFSFDGLLDAGKPFSHQTGQLKIYSLMKGEDYSINTIPWPSTKTRIPLVLHTPEAGTYNITRSQLQNTGETGIFLTDHLTGSSIDLTATDSYTFSALQGTITGRFALTIIPAEKSVAAAPAETPETDDVNLLKIYAAQGRVCILPQGNDWDGVRGKVRIFDITGRIILVSEYERFNSGELKEFYPGDSGNLLIVEVTAGDKRYLEKVVLSR
ncbi:MAG: right-handed parallel beta-helix repeat-containing protein [Bacteroidales bacterium]|nr:right-handed parallel beta-helix repeat-containing protein [Bacteroidales bacterium]